MPKAKGFTSREGVRPSPSDLMIDSENYFGRLAVGTWNPPVDLCETGEKVTLRVELPGVDQKDIRLTFQRGILKIQGVKREPAASKELLCYYCLERSYGRFNREIAIDWEVDARHALASLEQGVLTIEIPKVSDRRGAPIDISIRKKAD